MAKLQSFRPGGGRAVKWPTYTLWRGGGHTDVILKKLAATPHREDKDILKLWCRVQKFSEGNTSEGLTGSQLLN